MKVVSVALLLFLIAMPALARPTKTADGVEFECEVTGSHKRGFTITGTNTTKVRKICSVSCELTNKDGKIETYKADSRPVEPAPQGRDRSQRFWLEGQAGLKNGPYSSPDITLASCR